MSSEAIEVLSIIVESWVSESVLEELHALIVATKVTAISKLRNCFFIKFVFGLIFYASTYVIHAKSVFRKLNLFGCDLFSEKLRWKKGIGMQTNSRLLMFLIKG